MSRAFGWRDALMGLLALVFLVAAFAVPAIPQPSAYHQFGDGRTLFGVANFFNVVSNLPFLLAGAWGIALILRGEGHFLDPRERLPYLVFFLGAVLTCAGSAWYHWAPDNTRLVWDRLPMTMGFAGLLAAAFAERADHRLGPWLLWPLLILGVFTVLYWDATERAGAGNLVPYAAYQAASILLLVALLLLYPSARYSAGRLLGWAVGWYALAKVFETFDGAVYRLTGGALSGHTIKHLLAAVAVCAIVWQLRVRQPSMAAP